MVNETLIKGIGSQLHACILWGPFPPPRFSWIWSAFTPQCSTEWLRRSFVPEAVSDFKWTWWFAMWLRHLLSVCAALRGDYVSRCFSWVNYFTFVSLCLHWLIVRVDFMANCFLQQGLIELSGRCTSDLCPLSRRRSCGTSWRWWKETWPWCQKCLMSLSLDRARKMIHSCCRCVCVLNVHGRRIIPQPVKGQSCHHFFMMDYGVGIYDKTGYMNSFVWRNQVNWCSRYTYTLTHIYVLFHISLARNKAV